MAGWAHTRIRRRCVEQDPEPAQLSADGATAHDDPAQAVEHADVVITMVPDARAVETGTCSSWRPGRRRRGRGWTRCSPRSASAPSGWAPPDRPLPLVEAVRDRWAELDEAGLGGLDVAAARHGLDKPDAAAR